jgi:glycosyltransferase involved in cell wall biosynthesis
MRRVYVASVGHAEDPLTWSGIPYHLTEAGKAVGFISGGLPLDTRGRHWRWRRGRWNLLRMALGDRRGGYQFSTEFLERLWTPIRKKLANAAVINCFHLYPPSVVADDSIERWFFIDLTMELLFNYYRLRPTVGRRIAAEAVARERVGYESARGIVVMSHFAAESVRRDYGVPQERIHVVVPGANLDPVAYARWEENRNRFILDGRFGETLRLVMVSTDWQRKGMDRLLRALALARQQGLKATLRVVGARREELPADIANQEGIEWLGRINKNTDAHRFLEAVADADVGCIFSRYEAGGSVLREYHALGLAAFATDAGGMPDFMFADAAVTVPAEASDEEMAAALVALGRDPDRLARLRAAAWRRRREALWETTVSKLRAVIG